MTLQATRNLLADERKWIVSAYVAVHEDQTTHWEIGEEGQLHITVVTQQHAVPLTCILGSDHGIWRIPAVGTEVLVGFTDGEFEGDAYIVGKFETAPSGLSETNTLIIGSNIEIRSAGGSGKRVLTVDDGNELKDAIANAVIVPNDGGASLQTTIGAALVAWPTGTTTEIE